MNSNKTILVGIIFIIITGTIFITNTLNPIIRPITYLFLMGSSKGKDIIFFSLLGLFLMLSQAGNVFKKNINENKYLKISILLGCMLLILGILLEILFRYQMGISLNCVFVSMNGEMSSTSILHTHLLKSVIGNFIVILIGPFIQNGINTGTGLYAYTPSIANLIVFLIPILFITLVLSNQKRPAVSKFLLAFFSSCLIIGSFDGGLFSTPAATGIIGIFLVYRNGYYFDYFIGKLIKNEKLIKKSSNYPTPYQNKQLSKKRFLFNRLFPYIAIALFLVLRISVAFAGAEADYYTINIINPGENIDLNELGLEKIGESTNNCTYHANSTYNEMKLINDLKIPLNGKCDYYTVSWNIYSYL